MTIITITLNPAFDRHCYIADFEAGHEFVATDTQIDAGGKGVNIARALTVNGVESETVVVLGEQNRESFCAQLKQDGLAFQDITVSGRIRENLTIHTDTGTETRIAFAGFSIDGRTLDRVYEMVEPLLVDEPIVTLTGRMPDSLPMTDLQRFVAKLKAQGAKLVIDSRSFTKADLIEAAPWLIKPNQEEITTYLDRPINGFADALAGAKALCAAGIEQVMVSLGEQGAMLVTAADTYVATAPAVTVQSTVGAGDSSIAGFLAARKEGCSPAACLARAVAFGSAACETSGTRPPHPNAVARLLTKITVQFIGSRG